MSGFLSDLFVMQVAGGQPLPLTTGNSGGPSAWTQDGSEIIFASPAKGFRSLWRISASGGTPQRVAGPGDAIEPSISRRGNQLAYQSLEASRTPFGGSTSRMSGMLWRLPRGYSRAEDSFGGPAILPMARRSRSNLTAWAIAIFGCATAMDPIALS